MVQARIQFDSVTGSNPPNGSAIEPGDVITCNNLGNGGESTYLWEFLDVPPGSLAAFSNANVQSPTFTADCEGTYLVRVTVNRLLSSEKIDTQIIGVRQVRNPTLRVPAAYESTQMGVKGWALSVNTDLRLLDQALSDSNRRVGVADGSTLLRGQIVAQTGNVEILVGLPGESIIGTYELAEATDADMATGPLFIVEGAVDGTTAAADGSLVVVRALGLFGPMTPVGLTVPGDVFLSDTGTLDNVPGTNPRRLGKAIVSVDANEWVQFDGVSGAAGAAMVVEPFVFQSNPAGTYAGAIVLTNLTTPVDLITAANINNLRLTRFSAAQTAGMVLLRDEFGSDIFRIDKAGNITISDPDSLLVKTIETPVGLVLKAGLNLLLDSDSAMNFRVGGSTRWSISSSTGALQAQGGNKLISNVADPVSAQDAATRAYVLANSWTSFMHGNGAVAAGAGNVYLDPGYSERAAPETAGGLYPTPRASRGGVVRNLRIYCRVGPTGADLVVEIMVGGILSGVTVTIPAGVTAFAANDTTNSLAVSAGATLYVRVAPSGTTLTDTEDLMVTYELAGA